MALLEEQFTETLQAGAPDITYQGNQGKEQKIARELWDNLPPEAQQKFGNFQQFFSSGAWKQVLQMLQQQMQQAPQQMAQQPQQGLGSMMPAQMARGGTPEEVISLMEGIRTPRGEEVIDDTMTLASASDPMDDKNQISLSVFGKPLHELTPDELIDLDEYMEDKAQKWAGAYGGIAGADGRMQYGIGSWFQKKIMDPIKGAVKSPLGKAAIGIGLGTAAHKGWLPGGVGEGWWDTAKQKAGQFLGSETWKGSEEDGGGGLRGLLMNPNFLIPAAGLVAGTFAKKDDPGYTGQGTGLNLRDVGRIANITDPKTAMASGLRFSPDLETRKFTPAEMLESYAATDAENFSTPAAAQGGRIGYDMGGDVLPEAPMSREEMAERGAAKVYDEHGPMTYSELRKFRERQRHERMLKKLKGSAQGGRIGYDDGGSTWYNPFSWFSGEDVEEKVLGEDTASKLKKKRDRLKELQEQLKAQGGRIGYADGKTAKKKRTFLDYVLGKNWLEDPNRELEPWEERARLEAGKAQGGRIGYALGEGVGSLPRDQMKEIEGQTAGPDWFTRRVEALMYEGYSYEEASEIAYTEGHGGAYDYARGGRIGAQEGGLMSLGGMEMDLRGGGFVPLGAKEKADDVPARLSKNEFVFTADAVRAAGGGDVDAGADKMYNTMKQLESRVG